MKRQTRADQSKRHRLAIERTAAWAEDAAAAGDVVEALAWLRAIEAVEGRIPARLLHLLEECVQRLDGDAETRRRLPAAA